MCGIVGYIGRRDALPILMEGLARLEYRGYDSAGVAVQRPDAIAIHKCQGRVRDLEGRLPTRGLKSRCGIAHTRWATHGEPSDVNAHPHASANGRVVIAHNGIVENAASLRSRLGRDGVALQSDTDSEVLAHLIAAMPGGALIARVRAALQLVTGAYGLVVMDLAEPETIVVARNGSPVVLGIGDGEMFVASDTSALVRHTQRVVHLDDGELAEVRADGYQTVDLEGGARDKTPMVIPFADDDDGKGEHAHFMAKEISEQADAVRRTLSGRIDRRFSTARLDGLSLDARELLGIRRVKVLGCGSARIAGSIGAHLIEQLARLPADAEAASEFRYRNPVIESDTLYVAVSQSGETFDTLAAIAEVKRRGGHVLGIVNVVGSTIARECGRGIYLHAGAEVSVVSTKTFTCTLVAFALLALHLGRLRDLPTADGERLIAGLEKLPEQIDAVLQNTAPIEAMATALAPARDAYFVGRAAGFPIAVEGALKLKEVSYLHAEAYPASELKHGPLALIEPELPTVFVLPRDALFAKNVSTIEEIRARRGPVHVITHPGELPVAVDSRIDVPRSEPELDPILLDLPLQWLAYYVAQAKGRDIDRPRNLAKSVTVE